MNEIAIVVISIVVLIVGVIVYGVVGSEEDVNENYIPDRFERMVGKNPKKKEEK